MDVPGPQGAAPALRDERTSGTVLGITFAPNGEGKSTNARAFARTPALAGERVIFVDSDLRRAGRSRLLSKRSRFTLDGFLKGGCKAQDVIAVQQRSAGRFIPSTPVEDICTNQDLRHFVELLDQLKQQFSIVIIDLPPVLDLVETVRLAVAMDNIALIVRWGRTEQQLVQYAIAALNAAGVSAHAAILDDIDLKAQRRRGYRDRTVVYAYGGLYRRTHGDRDQVFIEALLALAGTPDAISKPTDLRRDHPEVLRSLS